MLGEERIPVERVGRSGTAAPWVPAPSKARLRLRASAAGTAPPCGESLLELAFQSLRRDVMFCLNLRGHLDPDPRGLEADDLHVVGPVLPV
jgi:hypothetical protein